jgi:hypothetical protein
VDKFCFSYPPTFLVVPIDAHVTGRALHLYFLNILTGSRWQIASSTAGFNRQFAELEPACDVATVLNLVCLAVQSLSMYKNRDPVTRRAISFDRPFFWDWRKVSSGDLWMKYWGQESVHVVSETGIFLGMYVNDDVLNLGSCSHDSRGRSKF